MKPGAVAQFDVVVTGRGSMVAALLVSLEPVIGSGTTS